MEFLKEILGEEFFKQFMEKVNAYNGNEANKDKQVKLANLSTGEYVGKGKHDALQASFDGQKAELDKANGLIAELQKGTKDNAAMQEKITAYETEKAQLQAENEALKVKYALDVAMRDAGVKKENAELLSIALERKLKEKNEKIELDANGSIKGWDDKLKDLKTQFPVMFEGGSGGGEGGSEYQPLEGGGLPKGGSEKTVTKEQFRSMSYEERAALKKSNEKLYESLRG